MSGPLAPLQRRRTQLWIVSSVLHVGLGLSLVLALGGARAAALASPWVRTGLVLVTLAFSAYGLEQERRLRNLAAALLEEHSRAEALAHAATHDQLTGVLTGAVFDERVGAALARSKRHGDPFAVLVVGVGGLDRRGRHLGGPAADTVLVEVAGRLQANVRAEDAVARVGEGRFAVLLEDLDRAPAAATVATRILGALRPSVEVDGERVRVDAAVGGVVHRGGRKEQLADLLRDAELAHRLARRRGGNGVELFDRTGAPPAPANAVVPVGR